MTKVFNFTYTDPDGLHGVSNDYQTPEEAKQQAESMMIEGVAQETRIKIFQDVASGEDRGLDCKVVAIARK